MRAFCDERFSFDCTLAELLWEVEDRSWGGRLLTAHIIALLQAFVTFYQHSVKLELTGHWLARVCTWFYQSWLQSHDANRRIWTIYGRFRLTRLEHFDWTLSFAEPLDWAQRSVNFRLILWVHVRGDEARFESRLLLKSRNNGSLVLKI